MTRIEKARKLTEEAKQSYLRMGREWTKQARIFSIVKKEELWNVDFKSFSEWAKAVANKGHSQAYSMADTYDKLKDSIPEEELRNMPFDNACDFAEVPESKRTPELAKAAAELPNNLYRRKLNKDVPGVSLEEKLYKGFQLEKTFYDLADHVFADIRQKHGVTTDVGAFEWLIADYAVREGLDVPEPVGEKVAMSEPGQPRVN